MSGLRARLSGCRFRITGAIRLTRLSDFPIASSGHAAARATGKAKATIHRALKSGKLSARRDEAGAYHIDPAELARVFPLVVSETSQRDVTPPLAALPERDALTRQEVGFLRDALDRERETVADLRKRLDWAEGRVLALTAQPAPPSAPEPVLMVEEVRRRLEEAEAQIRALVTAASAAPQAVQERPSGPSAGMTPAGPLRGLLTRLLGR